MFRKRLFSVAALFALATGIAVSVSAQTAPTSGTVYMMKDGKKVPVEGALIEAYGQSNAMTPTKTDKKGYFSFAGLMWGYKYTLVVSGTGIGPEIQPGVSGGTTRMEIEVKAGDGRHYTEAEVRDALEKAKSGGNTVDPKTEEEAKKAQAEYEAKKKAYDEAKAKSEANFANAQKLVKEGDAALDANNYDLAIAKYDEGFNSDPEFAGTAPTFLAKKADVQRRRGIDTYNKGTKAERSVKLEMFAAARKDMGDAAENYKKALDMVAAAPAKDITPENAKALTTFSLFQIKELVRIGGMTGQIDPRLPVIAEEFVPKYIASETDVAKKNAALVNLGDMFLASGDVEKAVKTYREALAADANNVDALAGVGLSLVNSGYATGDKAQLQEAANYLGRFVSVAPDSHRLKKDAEGILTTLKGEKITPQKIKN
ncbi:MAG TPA: tetratricopeptide repeat protein [Pyrinomonadaceae bacterium]|nr:tetratricopeptide repeat protein [Pyrinomonadaceae bacterium]